jgi:quercetin dioxygenase-like cupin family protein
MGFEVYDYRTVNSNVLVTPEIRARLYHMKPGQVDHRHSHDLGHEVFLILEGRAEFEINNTRKELGPGQMCVALADEIHQVRNLLPDKPTIMYLSVTPHIQPTHTGRDDKDQKLPPHFNANANYDDPTDMSIPLTELLDRELAALRTTADVASQALATHEEQAARLRAALDANDTDAAIEARNHMWDAIYTLHKQIYALGQIWNEFSPRVDTESASKT